jgi:hypothetical protein
VAKEKREKKKRGKKAHRRLNVAQTHIHLLPPV